MTYDTPQALRAALEARIRNASSATGVSPRPAPRRVLFERIVARLEAPSPGRWVLKGGMALEVRLRDAARLTKDIDLGLRDEIGGAGDLRERLGRALGRDDRTATASSSPSGHRLRSREDGGGAHHLACCGRASACRKAVRRDQVDSHLVPTSLTRPTLVPFPSSLDFAGIETVQVEIVDVHRHAAEKLHAMLRDFGDRENTRVRDLVDLVLLIETGFCSVVAALGRRRRLSGLSVTRPRRRAILLRSARQSGRTRYERLAAEHDVEPAVLSAAAARAAELWAEMFPIKEA